ncbi:MAG: AAA family ATPase [Bacteroidota bacterium]
MITGFTCGKFLPFHKGHEALIRFGLEHCDELTVLVCASDQELISGETRAAWIRNTCSQDPGLIVKVLPYKESQLPNTSESSRRVSKIWASEFRRWVPNANIFFSSEPYGAYVADFMNIQHLSFDLSRTTVPVSATQIRENPGAFWEYLPVAVRPNYCKKVVILGTESTGKSTLTKQLANHYKVPFVAEAGRDLISNSREFALEELYLVARAHAGAIAKAVKQGYPLIIVDTDIHITQSYARLFFDKQLEIEEAVYTTNKADIYLYLTADVPLVQDGTRLGEAARQSLDASHRRVLSEYSIKPIEIAGEWEGRKRKAIETIDRLFLPSGQKIT